MTRPVRSSIARRTERLECRDLRAGGLGSALDVVRDLGVLSPSAAIAGVEVTATIPAKGSVTFGFRAEQAGEYTLLVRFEGGGLGLNLSKDGGARVAVPVGPAGPFETLSLPVAATSYQIRASALGGGPVFVDWELLLNSGVGQAGALGISTVPAPSPAIPLPSPAGQGSSPAGSGLGLGSPGGTGMAAVIGGPLGRPGEVAAIAPVGPTSGSSLSALAFAGHDLPDGLILDLAIEAADLATTGPARPIPTMEILADAASKRDAAALGELTWLEGLFWGRPVADPDRELAEPGAEDAVALVAIADLEPPAPGATVEGGRTQRAGLGLGFVGVAGIVAGAVRRGRRKKRAIPAWQRFEDSERGVLPLSMA